MGTTPAVGLELRFDFGLVVVNVDSLELEIGITVVRTGGVKIVFVGDDFPELGTDQVTALASL